ncbi:MAG: hypothetical protein ABEH80_03245 [Halobaculum sp.]
MSETSPATGASERVYEQYVLGVRVVEVTRGEPESPRYRFEAPNHETLTFTDPEMATLYADVYFAVNGFVEEGTGDRGVPPEVMQGGKHTLAAYLITQTSADWVASFYGADPQRIERYVSWVREQAEEVRVAAREDVTD